MSEIIRKCDEQYHVIGLEKKNGTPIEYVVLRHAWGDAHILDTPSHHPHKPSPRTPPPSPAPPQARPLTPSFRNARTHARLSPVHPTHHRAPPLHDALQLRRGHWHVLQQPRYPDGGAGQLDGHQGEGAQLEQTLVRHVTTAR